MKTIYVWVNSKHEDLDLIYASSVDNTLELEKLEVQIENGESVFEATKRKLREIKGE